MKDCGSYREIISCLIDGELSAEEKAELCGHLESCSECRALYAAFTAVSDELGELEDVPASVTANVMSEIRREKSRRSPAWKRLVPAVACAAIVIFAGTRLGAPTGTKQENAVSYETKESTVMSSENSFAAGHRGEESVETADDLCNAVPDAVNAGATVSAGGKELVLSLTEELEALLARAEDTDAVLPAAPDYTVTVERGNGETEIFELYRSGGRLIAKCGGEEYFICGDADAFEAFLADIE